MRKGDGEKRRRADAEMRRRGENGFFIKSFLLFAAAFFGFACQPNAAILESAKNATAEQSDRAANGNSTVNSFERDLETMRIAKFDYIYVFRRKDGAPMSGDDKKYLKMNSPAETNRFILSDGDKAVIAGSKYKFAQENLMALQDRFAVQDFSQPPPPSPPFGANGGNANS